MSAAKSGDFSTPATEAVHKSRRATPLFDFEDRTSGGARRRITVTSEIDLLAERERKLDSTETAALKDLIDRSLGHFGMLKADVVDHSCSGQCPCSILGVGKLDRKKARESIENARRARGLSLKKASALVNLLGRSDKVREWRRANPGKSDPLMEALFGEPLAFMRPAYVVTPAARKGYPTVAFHPATVRSLAEWLTDSIVGARLITGERMVSKVNRDELALLLERTLCEIAEGSNKAFIDWFEVGCGSRIVEAIDNFKIISDGDSFHAGEGTTRLRVSRKLDFQPMEGSRPAKPHEILAGLLYDCAQFLANNQADVTPKR